MAEPTTVARPYAEAIFRLAQQEKTFQHWSDTLTILALAGRDAAFVDWINHPQTSLQAGLQCLLEILAQHATEQVKNFLTVVLENRRIKVLPQVLELFSAMRAESEDIAKAHVESAFALDKTKTAALTRRLESYLNKKVEANVIVNPELIGGVRITVGDKVIDASVSGKLSSLATRLKS